MSRVSKLAAARKDNPSIGRYSPMLKCYGQWASDTIYHPIPRRALADTLRMIRAACGTGEAKAFSAYLSWLGTWPVVNGGRWVNRYGRSPVPVEAGAA
jgi:hypothetical protein